MHQLIQSVENNYRKKQVVDVRSGDSVRVHQKITEGNKERVQIFEGFVIRTDRKGSVTSRITVRRIASGVGVEKSFLLHSPLVVKVEVVKRAKVRRKYLTYMRERSGKSARLLGVSFDKEAVNTIDEILDKEVGAVEAKKSTDVTPKDEKPAETEAAKPEEVKEEAKDEVKEETKEEVKQEAKAEADSSAPVEKVESKEEKELSKKEKAEAFRKAQEEKKK